MVNNAYWLQGLANYFNAYVVAGLEDAEDLATGEREFYSSAQFFQPQPKDVTENCPVCIQRYEKRVLVPMGEYIPFSFCRELAAAYGVTGSFTCGKEAKVFEHPKSLVGISICYEETFGDMMRENRLLGAGLLVNLTSDVWYPNSRLPQQHLDHAKLRTIENGIPLIRACNTGVTGAFDSLGRTVAILGEGAAEPEWVSDSLYVEVPSYTYKTFYTKVGDNFIIIFSAILVLVSLCFRDFKLKE